MGSRQCADCGNEVRRKTHTSRGRGPLAHSDTFRRVEAAVRVNDGGDPVGMDRILANRRQPEKPWQ